MYHLVIKPYYGIDVRATLFGGGQLIVTELLLYKKFVTGIGVWRVLLCAVNEFATI